LPGVDTRKDDVTRFPRDRDYDVVDSPGFDYVGQRWIGEEDHKGSSRLQETASV